MGIESRSILRDVFGPGSILGYCTNVHPVEDGGRYDALLEGLERYALGVKRRVCPDGPMGIGLWLSAELARGLIERNLIGDLAGWLSREGLVAFTLNGFPYGDFHRGPVKRGVYNPGWDDPRRLRYTLDLVMVLSRLLEVQDVGGEMEGSVSTLPVGWGPSFEGDEERLDGAVENLLRLCEQLEAWEERTGRLIHVDLEPEPGCVLGVSGDVVGLFERLDERGDAGRVRRYLRVCHDICHAAVMFEPQERVLEAYREAGVGVGKVQVSSGIHVPMDRLEGKERGEAVEQLMGFAEDRYLHQCVIGGGDDPGGNPGGERFYEDLPAAIEAYRSGDAPGGAWRVHFHVPLFMERIGRVETTQGEVGACLRWLKGEPSGGLSVKHFEVETYAWGVLPEGAWGG